jgi:outer membrane receptor protein involved in Fe transport
LAHVTTTDAASTVLDLKGQQTFNAAGTHDLTFGVYRSHYTWDPNFQAALIASESAANARLVDMTVVDAAGNQVGPSLTTGGLLLPGWFGWVSHAKADGNAAYLLDHWETLQGKLKIDVGVRWQDLRANVDRRDRNTLVDLTPSNVVVGSTQDTAADNEIQFPGKPNLLNKTYHGIGWSLGGNYSFSRPLAVYALASSSFRLPSLEDLNNLSTAGAVTVNGRPVELSPVEHIRQYETGLRYLTREFGASVALFYNKFSPRSAVNVYKDFQSPTCASTGGIPQINSCPDVVQTYKRGVRNDGTEIELSFRPRMVEGLELKGNVVFQNPKVEGARFQITDEDKDAQGVITGYHYLQINQDGRRPGRLAKVMVNFQPSYDLMPATGIPLTVYGQYQYVGDRFSHSGDNDVTLYPAYGLINMGAQYQISQRWMAQLHVANLTDKGSFTEGDSFLANMLSPDGTRNRGLARPLFGRIIRASLTYRF